MQSLRRSFRRSFRQCNRLDGAISSTIQMFQRSNHVTNRLSLFPIHHRAAKEKQRAIKAKKAPADAAKVRDCVSCDRVSCVLCDDQTV